MLFIEIVVVVAKRIIDWGHAGYRRLDSSPIRFQILEEDFKKRQERRRRENVGSQFRLNMELQLEYLERTSFAALLGAGGYPRVEDKAMSKLLLTRI